MRKNIVITAVPHTGKSTLLQKVIAEIPQKRGFYAREQKDARGVRTGFECVTNNEKHDPFPLAYVSDEKSPYRVGKYVVNLDHLDTYCKWSMNFSVGESDMLYIDEIGQMQLYSEPFKKYVLKCFDSEATTISTISAIYYDPFIEEIKKRTDVILLELTEKNRNSMAEYILTLVRKINKARRYMREPQRFSFTSAGIIVTSDHSTPENRRVVHLNTPHGHICTCDFSKREYGGICSHILAAEILQNT